MKRFFWLAPILLLTSGCTINYTQEHFVTLAKDSETDHTIQDNDSTTASTDAAADIKIPGL
jgi:hypothetical protein